MDFFNRLFNRKKLEEERKLKAETRRLEEQKQKLENEIARLTQERIGIEERKIAEIKKDEFEEQNRIETLKDIEKIDKLVDNSLSEEKYNYLNDWDINKEQTLIVESEENEKVVLDQVNNFQDDHLYNNIASFYDLLDNSFDDSYKFFDFYSIYKFYDFYMDNEFYKFCNFNDFFEFCDIYHNNIDDREDMEYYLKLIFDDEKNKLPYISLEVIEIISYYKDCKTLVMWSANKLWCLSVPDDKEVSFKASISGTTDLTSDRKSVPGKAPKNYGIL